MSSSISKHRLCRRLGRPICGLAKCPAIKRPYTPGMHGRALGQRKKSVFGRQLEEKQKLKFIYGLSERQLKNLFKKVAKKKGPTGENLLALLESRLDNIVYRLGFAPTRWAARQLVAHKHIQVNGRTVNVRSFYLKPGDRIKVREKSRMFKHIQERLVENAGPQLVSYLDLNKINTEGIFLNFPKRSQIPEDIEEHLVVEYYAK